MLIIFLSVVCALFLPEYASAKETGTIITSDSLEYFGETKQYVAKGSVKIEKEDVVITADEMTYNETTSDVIAVGKVEYHDADTSMKAEKAEMNLENKTGRAFDANIFYAKKNRMVASTPVTSGGRRSFLDLASIKERFYLSGKEIEKRGEDSYYSPAATFTACDAPIPAWCFKGKDVDVTEEEGLKVHDASFRIRNLPVLYTPYLWAPIFQTRQTGLLMPLLSTSTSRGFGLQIPYFWAISENRDATFVLDTYTSRGIGAGAEYRFIEPGGIKGYGWVYHIKDRELGKDFWELKGLYDNRSTDKLGGFLNLNILNEKQFYSEFSTNLDIRTSRFLESTGELNFPLTNSRFYLLSQYWIDLKAGTASVPQKLPEAGYVLNYTNLGGPLFSASATAANIWTDNGLSAGRIDLYPHLLLSYGKDFVVSQTAAVRETAYSYYHADNIDKSVQRAAFEYAVEGHTRLYRKYDSFLHVIEPSVSYHFIVSSENDLPVFDDTELFKKTSLIELSLLNRFITNGIEVATVRLSQGAETYSGDRPLKLELASNKLVPIKLNVTYNERTGKIDIVNSDITLNILKANISLGQTYNRANDIIFYRAGLTFSLFKSISFSGNLWYDSTGGGLNYMNMILRYQRQCWGLRFEMVKSPGDFTTMLMFELAGLNWESAKKQ